jgi:PAS domain S-box-containing protein
MSNPLSGPQLTRLLIISDNRDESARLTKFLNDKEKELSIKTILVSSDKSEFGDLNERFEIIIILNTNNLGQDLDDMLRDIKKKFLAVEVITIGCQNISESDITGINIFEEFSYPCNFGSVLTAINKAACRSREITTHRLISALNNVSSAILLARKTEEIMQITCKACVEILNVEHAGIALFDSDYSSGKAIAEHFNQDISGISKTIGVTFPVKGIPIEEKLVFEKKIIIVPDVSRESGFGKVSQFVQKLGIRSMLLIPIVVDKEVVASISLDSNIERKYSHIEIDICQGLANLAALAIENANSIEKAKQEADDMQRLLMSVRAGKISVDTNGRITRLDKNAEEVLGYTEEEILGEFVDFLYADPNTPKTVGNLLKESPSGKISKYETSIRAKPKIEGEKGEEIPILLSASWVYDFNKNRTGSVGVFDISKKEIALVKAQKAARLITGLLAQGDISEALKLVAQGTLEASSCDLVTLYEYDPSAEVLVNPPITAGIFRDHSKVLSTSIIPITSIVHKMFYGKRDIAIIKDVRDDPDFSKTRFAKEESITSCIVIPLTANGLRVGIMFVNYRKTYDLSAEEILNLQLFSDQAAAAIRIRRLYEQLVEQEKKRTAFMLDVTHQLVGPLSGLRSHCDNLLNARVTPQRGRVILETIVEESGHLQRYAENFAYAARGEKFIFDKDEWSPQNITKEGLISLLINSARSFQGQAKHKHFKGPSVVEFSFRDFPSLYIDLELFSIVILNLLDNAIKYSFEGSPIDIKGRVLEHEVEIEVVSHGIPLEGKDIKAIFDRYVRTEQAKDAVPVGTGIGLFLCCEIMKLHGGTIRATPSKRSVYGNEVTFVLSLPK